MPMQKTPPNIYGVETEYSCMMTFPGEKVYELVGTCHSVDAELDLYQEPKSKGSDHLKGDDVDKAIRLMGLFWTESGMLSNGGRFYFDPSGPEYCTPETTTAEEAVLRVFDGDEIVLGLFKRLRDADVLQDFQLNRRLVDHNRSSRGVHLNTISDLTEDKVPPKAIQETLYTLNVAKGAMFGSGGLLIDEEGVTHFHHSPRLSLTNITDAKFGNYSQRPLVRHPFKPDGEYARVETVTSDALNFAWPLRASLIATNSLIRVIERGYSDQFIMLVDPVKAAIDVGRFGHAAMIEVYSDEGEYEIDSPLNILRRICERILSFNQTESTLDDESLQVLPEIIDVADRMEWDPESVSAQVESMARWIAMQKKMDQRSVSLDSETLCKFDYYWDKIGGGLAERIRSKGVVGWQGFKAKNATHTANKRRLTPPKDTRASIRGALIKDSKGTIKIDWDGSDKRYLHPLDTLQK